MCIKTVKVKTENGLNDCKICLIQGIEKEIDKVMASNGFSRTTTTKSGDYLEFNYRQFGKAV
jgi:hypothetical protein